MGGRKCTYGSKFMKRYSTPQGNREREVTSEMRYTAHPRDYKTQTTVTSAGEDAGKSEPPKTGKNVQ